MFTVEHTVSAEVFKYFKQTKANVLVKVFRCGWRLRRHRIGLGVH